MFSHGTRRYAGHRSDFSFNPLSCDPRFPERHPSSSPYPSCAIPLAPAWPDSRFAHVKRYASSGWHIAHQRHRSLKMCDIASLTPSCLPSFLSSMACPGVRGDIALPRSSADSPSRSQCTWLFHSHPSVRLHNSISDINNSISDIQ